MSHRLRWRARVQEVLPPTGPTLSVRDQGGTLVVTVHGELDDGRGAALGRAVADATARRGAVDIVIDLRSTRHCTREGLQRTAALLERGVALCIEPVVQRQQPDELPVDSAAQGLASR